MFKIFSFVQREYRMYEKLKREKTNLNYYLFMKRKSEWMNEWMKELMNVWINKWMID